MIRLAHVCIETQDLEKSERFYRILGLKRQFEFRNKSGELVGFYLAFGDESFIEVILNRGKRSEGIIRHFAIETDDIDGVYRSLAAAGVDVTEKELAIDHTWMIKCHDPNGVFIEVMQYTEDSMQRVGGVCEVDYAP